jgi:hypothetical protein
MATEELESFTGDDWLACRARGLAHIMRRHPEEAVPELVRSLQAAGSTRRMFYSALDLCWAELASGNTGRSMEMAEFLADSFPSEGLPAVMLAICYQETGSFASAMMLLQRVSQDPGFGSGPGSMALELLEDFE